MEETKTLEDFFDAYNAIFDITESKLKDMSSLSVDVLKDNFNTTISYLNTMNDSIKRHEKISFLHNTPIIPGVGLLGLSKQKKENLKFLSCLEIKVYEDKGIHKLTQIVAEKILDLCSIQAELAKKGISVDETNSNTQKIKSIFADCENALNNLSNDAFAYNYEVQSGDAQLWGILTKSYEHCLGLIGRSKKKGFFSSLFE
jgi:hypothetical protein